MSYSTRVLQAVADELAEHSVFAERRFRVKDALDPAEVTITQVVTDYPGMGFSPEDTTRVVFTGARERALTILSKKVNGR